MKKIYGLCLNSAIDWVIPSLDLNIGEVNKTDIIDKIPAGKLVNTLRTCEALEIPITAHVFIGKGDSVLFDCFRKPIQLILHEVEGRTRNNISIISEDNQTVTHINSSFGYHLPQSNTLKLIEQLIKKWKDESILILSGSLPNGLSSSIYETIINEANKKGIKSILDTNNNALAKGKNAKPFSIKPNLFELNEIENINLLPTQTEKIVSFIIKYWNEGISLPIISLGKHGAIYGFSETQNIYLAYRTTNTNIRNGNSTGCGDSLVGALAYGIATEMDEESIIEYTQHAAHANLLTSIPGEITKRDMIKFIAELKIKQLKPSSKKYKTK